MSFTACSPGCCLLRRPILLLSDKAALLFSLCNPLFIGKNRPEPSSLPPRLPRSPDVTPSSILFSLRFPPTLSALASILSLLLPFPSILEKTLYFIDFFFFPFHALPSHARLYSFIPRSHTLRQPTLLLLLFFIAPSLSSSLVCRRF